MIGLHNSLWSTRWGWRNRWAWSTVSNYVSVLCVLWTHAEETVEHWAWSIVNTGYYQLLWDIICTSPHEQYLDGDQSYVCCLDRKKSYSVCVKMFIAFWENIMNLKSLAITEQTHQKCYTADNSWFVCKSQLNDDCAIELHISSSQHSEHTNFCLTVIVFKCIMVHSWWEFDFQCHLLAQGLACT